MAQAFPQSLGRGPHADDGNRRNSRTGGMRPTARRPKNAGNAGNEPGTKRLQRSAATGDATKPVARHGTTNPGRQSTRGNARDRDPHVVNGPVASPGPDG